MLGRTQRLDISLRVLTAGSNGTGLSSLISIEDVSHTNDERKDVAKVLFNVGDCTQRFCIENKIKLSRLQCIVLSSLATQNITGLIGILLCMSDLGCPKVDIIGPAGLCGLVHNASQFVNRKYPVITIHEVGAVAERLHFTFELYSIVAVPIVPAASQHASVGIAVVLTPSFCNQKFACIPVCDTFPTTPTIGESLKWIEALNCHAAVLLPLVTLPRPLSSTTRSQLQELCKKLSIFGIIYENARRSDICEIQQPQKSIALNSLFLPAMFPRVLRPLSAALVDEGGYRTMTDAASPLRKANITSNMKFGDMLQAVSNMMVRYSADDDMSIGLFSDVICKSVPFTEESLGDTALEEALRDASNKTLASSIHKNLNDVFDNVMKKMPSQLEYDAFNKVKDDRADVTIGNFELDIENECIGLASPGDVSCVRQSLESKVKCYCDSSEARFSEVDESMSAQYCSFCAMKRYPYNEGGLLGPDVMSPPNPSDPVVSFLGTGCATPSKHRSNSAILIKATEQLYCGESSHESMVWSLLMDAGEGVCCQLYHHCGGDTSRYNDILLSIRIIWISHNHADHHAGLIFLLSEIWRVHMISKCDNYENQWNSRYTNGGTPGQMPSKRVVVIAPAEILSYVEYAVCAAGIEEVVQFVDIAGTSSTAEFSKGKAASPNWTWALGPLAFPPISVPVHHCRNSFGLVIHLRTPLSSAALKIVFSGDCRPSETLVEAGMNCTLLIHEATFEDDLIQDAISKKHSSTSEAIAVAHRMNASHVILTHFSQRYPKLQAACPKKSNVSSEISYCNAIDFLHVAVPSQLNRLSSAMAALSCSTIASLACNSDG